MKTVTLAPGVVYSTPRALTAYEAALLARAYRAHGEAFAVEALRVVAASPPMVAAPAGVGRGLMRLVRRLAWRVLRGRRLSVPPLPELWGGEAWEERKA